MPTVWRSAQLPSSRLKPRRQRFEGGEESLIPDDDLTEPGLQTPIGRSVRLRVSAASTAPQKSGDPPRIFDDGFFMGGGPSPDRSSIARESVESA